MSTTTSEPQPRPRVRSRKGLGNITPEERLPVEAYCRELDSAGVYPSSALLRKQFPDREIHRLTRIREVLGIRQPVRQCGLLGKDQAERDEIDRGIAALAKAKAEELDDVPYPPVELHRMRVWSGSGHYTGRHGR